MYIVRSGELVVIKLGDSGRVIRMAVLQPGDFFGEMTLIALNGSSSAGRATSPSTKTT
jgi:CRP-like cAMP-binding protein